MNKIRVIIALLIATTISSFAQNPIAKGQSQLNAGLGFSDWGIPIYVGLDYGVHPDITIGGELSFRSFNDRFQGDRFDHNIFGILGNANYHFNNWLNIPRKWDLYAGLNLGFYQWNSPGDFNGNSNSGLGIGAQIGGRYYFSDKLGINLEFGGGDALSGGKIGLSLKL